MPTGPYTDQNRKSFPAGGALAAFRHVKINSSGQLAYAGAGEDGIGITLGPASAAGDMVDVKLWTAAGTFPVTMSGAAATIGTAIYSAASGQFSTSASGTSRLVQLEAASGAGSVIEAYRV